MSLLQATREASRRSPSSEGSYIRLSVRCPHGKSPLQTGVGGTRCSCAAAAIERELLLVLLWLLRREGSYTSARPAGAASIGALRGGRFRAVPGHEQRLLRRQPVLHGRHHLPVRGGQLPWLPAPKDAGLHAGLVRVRALVLNVKLFASLDKCRQLLLSASGVE